MTGQVLPFVSIIVPVRNAERTIGRLLQSLAALDYPADRKEVWVVDNLSTDRTREIVRDSGFQLIEESRVRSSYAARNRGVRVARGDLLAFVDADCEVPREWLARTVPAFQDSKVGSIACEIVGPTPTTSLGEYFRSNWLLSPRHTLRHPFLPHPQIGGVIYRRQVFDRIGLFEPWVSGADADLAWRMQQRTDYRIHFEPSVVVIHHHRPTAWRYFKQRFKWAYGSAVLYRKYRGQMPYDWRKSRWETKQLFLRILRWPAVWWSTRTRDGLCPPWKREFYEVVTGLGVRIGRLVGSIRHGVWYV